MEFIDVFKDLLDKHDITQTELAHAMGFSPQAINKWYTGRSEPDIKTIKKISDYFGVTTDYLLGYKDQDEVEDRKILKRLLIKNKYILPGDNLSYKEIDNILKFIKNNREFLKEK